LILTLAVSALVAGFGPGAIPAHAAFTASAASSFIAEEGLSTGTITVATFTTDTPGDTFVASVNWGDGTPTDPATVVHDAGGNFHVTDSHTYAEDGPYTFTVTIVETGASPDTTAPQNAAIIRESNLTLTAGNDLSVTEGQGFTAQLATYTDPGSPDPGSDFPVTIDWGDGTTDNTSLSGGSGSYTVTGTHTYADEGTFKVTVTVVENAVLFSAGKVTLTASVAESDSLVGIGKTITQQDIFGFNSTVATFADANSAATASDFTATINWGDGTSSAGTVTGPAGGPFAVKGFHLSFFRGQYTILTTLKEDAPGTASANAVSTLNATDPPGLGMSFDAQTIPVGGTTTLNFFLNNPNSFATLNAIFFDDSLPAGLVIATPNGLSLTCTGESGGEVLAPAGGTFISFGGGTLTPSGSCILSINVTGVTQGLWLLTSDFVTSDGGTGLQANAFITVLGPPVVTKSFTPPMIPLLGTTTMQITISNPNAFDSLLGVGFTDDLPSGLAVAATANLTNTCGGTVTAIAGAGTVSLAGGTVDGNASCLVTVSITGIGAGLTTNTVQVTTTNAGASNTANATLTVLSPPALTKSFGASTLTPHGTSSLAFSVTNPNSTVALTGVAFTDTLPTGLVVSTPNRQVGSCAGGTISAVAGSSSISLSGATIAASSGCNFSVNVTNTGTTGQLTNTTSAVTSTNGGTGNTATATLYVAFPAKISAGFGVPSAAVHVPVKLTFKLTNPNTFTLTGVAFTDVMPQGLVVTTPNRLTGTCGGGTITAIAGDDTISLSGATLAANASCTFSVYVMGTTFGWKHNATSPVTAANAPAGNQALASILI
jgi:uncharacterized repeat protein (TIGR01451 family)